MYIMTISVDDLVLNMDYENYDQALKDFKECVIDLLNDFRCVKDDFIMKITKDYGLFMVQNEYSSYKLELKLKEGDE